MARGILAIFLVLGTVTSLMAGVIILMKPIDRAYPSWGIPVGIGLILFGIMFFALLCVEHNRHEKFKDKVKGG
ncbi:MAG: hypothetical protein Q7R84_02155 [bacterium]|nr:hypothetical protein [bacterium]